MGKREAGGGNNLKILGKMIHVCACMLVWANGRESRAHGGQGTRGDGSAPWPPWSRPRWGGGTTPATTCRWEWWGPAGCTRKDLDTSIPTPPPHRSPMSKQRGMWTLCRLCVATSINIVTWSTAFCWGRVLSRCCKNTIRDNFQICLFETLQTSLSPSLETNFLVHSSRVSIIFHGHLLCISALCRIYCR